MPSRLKRLILSSLRAVLALAELGAHARYSVSRKGVITDNTSGLEWVVGPDQSINFYQAEAWVKGCNIAGGGWRLPTVEELRGLYTRGLGERNMAPVFNTTGWWVWAEPENSVPTAWGFDHVDGDGEEYSYNGDEDFSRVFGVRSLSRR